MISRGRWKKAQEYEQAYWQRVAEKISTNTVGQLSWYSWKASTMEERIRPFIHGVKRESMQVLEVGCGPIGIISYLKWGKRFGIDPLNDFYSTNGTLTQLRDSSVVYCTGTGEKLPFESGTFGLVILDNVIDHVHNADLVLKEASRTLCEDGIVYLAVNIHTPMGGLLHSLLSRTRIDKGHPYTFTLDSMRRFVRTQGLHTLLESVDEYRESRSRDMKSSSLKTRMKAYLGLSEFIYYAVCSRPG